MNTTRVARDGSRVQIISADFRARDDGPSNYYYCFLKNGKELFKDSGYTSWTDCYNDLQDELLARTGIVLHPDNKKKATTKSSNN